MLHHTESKFQSWHALAVFEDGGESLLCLGRSTTQIRSDYGAAWDELFDEEERGRVRRIAVECWREAADQGRWVAKAELPLAARREPAVAA